MSLCVFDICRRKEVDYKKYKIFQEKHLEIFHEKLTGHFWTLLLPHELFSDLQYFGHNLSSMGGTKKEDYRLSKRLFSSCCFFQSCKLILRTNIKIGETTGPPTVFQPFRIFA